MKRYFYLTAAIAGLLMAASCQKEDFAAAEGDYAEVTFTADLPTGVATKAIADGQKVNKLYYEVYPAKDQNGEVVDGTESPVLNGEVEVKGGTANFNVRLIKNKYYTVFFWAQYEKDDYTKPYTWTDLRTINVSYANASSNDEFRDAFYHVAKGVKYTGAATEKIELHRPFAQVNVATSDLEEFTELGGKLVTSQITVTDVANTFEMFDDKASYSGEEGKDVVTFEAAEVPGEKLKNVNGKEYDYLAMAYVLFPGDAQPESSSTTTISVVVAEEDKTEVEIKYEGATVKRNHRTNLVGSFLTSTAEFDIVVDENFDNDNNYPDNLTEELLSAAQNGGYVKLTEGVTLDKTLTVEANMRIDLGEYTLTNQKDNETTDVIVVKEGATLTINATTGGVEAVTGNDGYAVISEGTLIINGGTFRSGLDETNDGNCTIYVRGNGKVYIHGGDFSTTEEDKTTHIINKKDADRETTTILIDGGTFKNFDPANNAAEDAGTNFLAEGYKTLSSTDADGNTIYTVVKKSELEKMVENGISGTVTLTEDVTLQAPLEIKSGEVILDLSENTITGSGLDSKGVIEVADGAKLTIKGNGTITTESAYPVLVKDGGELTVEGGNFTATNSAQAVYIQSAGTIYIKGGYYEVDSKYNGAEYFDEKGNGKYVLNCLDTEYENGTAKIIVTGGTFHKFDPQDNVAEGTGTNFVAEGYKSVQVGESYVVVKDNTEVITDSNADNISDMLNEGKSMVLDTDIELDKFYLTTDSDNEIVISSLNGKEVKISGVAHTGEHQVQSTFDKGNITFEGIVFDVPTLANGWAMSSNISGNAKVTFRNCTFTGVQCPIYQSGAASVVIIENCVFDVKSVAIQAEIYSGDFQLGKNLIIKDCDFGDTVDVLHIYDYDKDPSSEAIEKYLTENGNIFTGTCKQTCN